MTPLGFNVDDDDNDDADDENDDADDDNDDADDDNDDADHDNDDDKYRQIGKVRVLLKFSR